MTRSDTIRAIFNQMGPLKRHMQQHFHGGFTKLGLSPAQYEVLSSLQQHQPISHKELAHDMQMTPGAISQLLDGLDQAGCIVRTTNPSDRRISYLAVSRKGKQTVDSFRKQREQFFGDVFTVLSDAELAAYLRVQQQMTNWFDSHPISSVKQKETV